jgi:hypothetical protein
LLCKDTTKPVPMQMIEESDESDDSDGSWANIKAILSICGGWPELG